MRDSNESNSDSDAYKIATTESTALRGMARRAALQIALLACSLLFSLLPSSVAVDCPALTTDAPAGGQDLADCSCVGGYSGETRCDGNPPRSPLPPPGSKGGSLRADNGMSCDSPHATLALRRRTCWVMCVWAAADPLKVYEVCF